MRWDILDFRSKCGVKMFDVLLLWGLWHDIIVVFGFPSNSAITTCGEITSILDKFSNALGDRRRPTPPTEYFEQEAVTRWKSSTLWYLIASSGWKKQCSWIAMITIFCNLAFRTSSDKREDGLSVLVLKELIKACFLHDKSYFAIFRTRGSK